MALNRQYVIGDVLDLVIVSALNAATPGGSQSG